MCNMRFDACQTELLSSARSFMSVGGWSIWRSTSTEEFYRGKIFCSCREAGNIGRICWRIIRKNIIGICIESCEKLAACSQIARNKVKRSEVQPTTNPQDAVISEEKTVPRKHNGLFTFGSTLGDSVTPATCVKRVQDFQKDSGNYILQRGFPGCSIARKIEFPLPSYSSDILQKSALWDF
jgi:hypothetical protein